LPKGPIVTCKGR